MNNFTYETGNLDSDLKCIVFSILLNVYTYVQYKGQAFILQCCEEMNLHHY